LEPMRGGFSLVIGVSNAISAHCYSLIRLEPYTSCHFECMYCYARWYRGGGQPAPLYQSITAFRTLIDSVERAGTRLMPVRISTLVDPLQPPEEETRITLRLLRLAARKGYPVILNTKALLGCSSPWADVLAEMAARGLVVYQFSISVLNERLAHVLEPRAPSPSRRVEAAAKLAERGVPVVMRLSPMLPEIAREELDAIVEAAVEAGARHVVAECIRLPPGDFEALYRTLGLPLPTLESYGVKEDGLVWHSAEARLAVYRELATKLGRAGITFATCKEGLYELHTSRDCCGMYLLSDRFYRLRVTLFEVYRRLGRRPRDIGEVKEVLLDLLGSGKYASGRGLEGLPRYIRRPLANHEKRLLRIAEDPALLAKMAPPLCPQG